MTTRKTTTVRIPFIRTEEGKVSTLAILRVTLTHKLSTEAIIKTLTKLLTQWVKETKEGANAWKQSSEDFNIGDLALFEGNFNQWVSHTTLRAAGIMDYAIEMVDDVDGSVDYDLPLVDPNRL